MSTPTEVEVTETATADADTTEQAEDIGEQAAAVKGDDPTPEAEATTPEPTAEAVTE